MDNNTNEPVLNEKITIQNQMNASEESTECSKSGLEIVENVENLISGIFLLIRQLFNSLFDISFAPDRIVHVDKNNTSWRHIKPFSFLTLSSFAFITILRIGLSFVILFLAKSCSGLQNTTQEEINMVDSIKSVMNIPSIWDLLIAGVPMIMILFGTSWILKMLLIKKTSCAVRNIFETSCYAIGFQYFVISVVIGMVVATFLLYQNQDLLKKYQDAFGLIQKCVYGVIFIAGVSSFLRLAHKRASRKPGMNRLVGEKKLWMYLSNYGIPPLCIALFALVIHFLPKFIPLSIVQTALFFFGEARLTFFAILIVWPLTLYAILLHTSINNVDRKIQNRYIYIVVLILAVIIVSGSTLFTGTVISYQLAQKDIGEIPRPPMMLASLISPIDADSVPREFDVLLTNNTNNEIHILSSFLQFIPSKLPGKDSYPYQRLSGTIQSSGQGNVPIISLGPRNSCWITAYFSLEETVSSIEVPDSSWGLLYLQAHSSAGDPKEICALVPKNTGYARLTEKVLSYRKQLSIAGIVPRVPNLNETASFGKR